jgi:hypothetical protein
VAGEPAHPAHPGDRSGAAHDHGPRRSPPPTEHRSSHLEQTSSTLTGATGGDVPRGRRRERRPPRCSACGRGSRGARRALTRCRHPSKAGVEGSIPSSASAIERNAVVPRRRSRGRPRRGCSVDSTDQWRASRGRDRQESFDAGVPPGCVPDRTPDRCARRVARPTPPALPASVSPTLGLNGVAPTTRLGSVVDVPFKSHVPASRIRQRWPTGLNAAPILSG